MDGSTNWGLRPTPWKHISKCALWGLTFPSVLSWFLIWSLIIYFASGSGCWHGVHVLRYLISMQYLFWLHVLYLWTDWPSVEHSIALGIIPNQRSAPCHRPHTLCMTALMSLISLAVPVPCFHLALATQTFLLTYPPFCPLTMSHPLRSGRPNHSPSHLSPLEHFFSLPETQPVCLCEICVFTSFTFLLRRYPLKGAFPHHPIISHPLGPFHLSLPALLLYYILTVSSAWFVPLGYEQ